MKNLGQIQFIGKFFIESRWIQFIGKWKIYPFKV